MTSNINIDGVIYEVYKTINIPRSIFDAGGVTAFVEKIDEPNWQGSLKLRSDGSFWLKLSDFMDYPPTKHQHIDGQSSSILLGASN